jgi:hypothetical protein
MGEGISAAAIGLNETKTFGIVEPFDRTTGHTMSPSFCWKSQFGYFKVNLSM